ncbi:MAG TPA: PPC domain-containing protein [Candidatus Thermoplasmatota archaeon]|nr:PPC domain-containing protein [Candidatus Thermoplasmatota archaeon]
MASLRVLALAMVLSIALAGCFGAKEANVSGFEATGKQPKFARGWAYNGQGLQAATGTVEIATDEAANTGLVNLSVKVGADAYEVRWTSFVGDASKPFQSGGVAKHLPEHGDTGNGDTLSPKIIAESAAWGEAEILLNGQVLPDPVTGRALWNAHYMYADEGFRAADGRILNAAKSAPYDPAKPSDGSNPGKPQLVVVFKSGASSDPALWGENFTETVLSPTYSKAYTIPVNRAGDRLAVNLSIEGPAAGGPVPADLTFTLKGPDGAKLAEAKLGGASATQTLKGLLEVPAPKPGEYKLEVAGPGAQAKYVAAATVLYPTSATLLFHFDEVEVRKLPAS